MKSRLTACASAALLILFFSARGAFAQTTSEQDASAQSWNETTTLQDQAGTSNPTRVVQSHKEADGASVDTQTVEARDINGETQVYGQTQTETIKVNETTTRITTRHYVTNADGQKVVNSVTVEEKKELPDGGESVVRTVSNPDANGALQVTRREMQETTQTAPDARVTNRTVLLPGANGGLAASTRTQEVDKQVQPGVTQFKKSVSFADGSGNWQVNEVREGTVEKGDGVETRQENVSTLNADGKLAVSQRTVTKETKADGQERRDVQKFSNSMGGTTAYSDGQLHLDQQVTTVTRTGPGGEQVTEQQVQQRSPAAPDAPLQLNQRVIDISRIDLQGATQQTETIESATPNGGVGVVWVDTRKKSGSSPVVVDTKQPANPPR